MAGPTWTAVRAVGRHELRRRWRSVVVLGVLAGLVGAFLVGGLQLLLRTATAPERLAEATRVDDARVVLFGDAVDPAALTSLPGVADAAVRSMGVGQLTGAEQLGYTSISSGPVSGRVFTPVVVEGRAVDPAAADEVLVVEEFADAFGLSVGDTLPVAMLTPEELSSFDTGFGDPDGPRLELRITGLARLARDFAGGNGMAPVLAGPAFADAHRGLLPVTTVMLRLQDDSPAAEDRIAAEVARLSERLVAAPGAEEFPPLSVDFPQADGGQAVRSARSVLLAGLGVLLAVAAVAGVLAVGQALTRHAAVRAPTQRVEAALGMTAGERSLARALPALLGAAVAAAVTVVGALVAARLEPLGALAAYEPEPGWRPDVVVVVAGALLVAVALVAGTALAAARVLRPAGLAVPAEVARGGLLRLAARRAPVLAGTAFALTRSRARSGVPVAAALSAAVLGVAGVVAAATFATSLDRLAGTPARYGWTGDFAWIDAKEPELREIEARDDVVGLAKVDEGRVRVAGADVAAYAATVRKGGDPWTVLSGRSPQAAGEVALGARLAAQLGLAPGDATALQTPDGGLPVRVVGTVAVPALGGERFGEVVVLTPDDLATAATSQPFAAAVVDVSDAAAADALFDELSGRLELERQAPPRDVQNLLDLGRLPAWLGGFLAVLSLAVLAHALVLTTRRRAADLAVLRVIGFTPRQVGAALVSMATTTAVVGLVAGVPLGLATGRVVWSEVAGELGVARDVALPWTVLGAAPVAVLLTAVVVSVLPARRAARVSPASVLRAE